jgi:hypothetical protein
VPDQDRPRKVAEQSEGQLARPASAGALSPGSEDSDRQLTVHHSRERTSQRVGECPGQI